MGKLIDASTLIRRDVIYNGMKVKAVLRADIYNAPVVDAVPVIRCKDCKYFVRSDFVGTHCSNYDFDPIVQHEAEEDDFCSFAERRT